MWATSENGVDVSRDSRHLIGRKTCTVDDREPMIFEQFDERLVGRRVHVIQRGMALVVQEDPAARCEPISRIVSIECRD